MAVMENLYGQYFSNLTGQQWITLWTNAPAGILRYGEQTGSTNAKLRLNGVEEPNFGYVGGTQGSRNSGLIPINFGGGLIEVYKNQTGASAFYFGLLPYVYPVV